MLMEYLKDYNPKLIGSVWRGTAHINSDIDIEIFSIEQDDIINSLQIKFQITDIQSVIATRLGQKHSSTHITLRLSSGDEAEIIIKEPKLDSEQELCSIYGDPKIGLTISQLDSVLKKDPLQRFVPKRRSFVFQS